MPERRNNKARASSGPPRVLGAVASIAGWLLARAARRPVDSLALIGAAAASVVIVVNALFLQSHGHLAPFVANPAPPPQTFENRLAAPLLVAPRGTAGPGTTPQQVSAVSAHRSDPIAELISSSTPAPSRVVAVQRVLSQYGYGQIRTSGILDEATSATIRKFESDHKLPVTGRISDHLLSELGAMTSQRIQ